MRIFIQNSASPNTWGERDAWLCDVAIALQQRGHEIFCGGKPNSRFLQECQRLGFRIYPLETKSDISMVSISRFRQLFKRLGIEGVLANLGKDVRLAGAGARLAGQAVVLARHTVPMIKNNWRYQLTYKNLVDGILTPSPTIATMYRQYSWLEGIPIFVVPEGVQDLKLNGESRQYNRQAILEKYGIKSEYPIITMYGELLKYKQQDIFIDVAREVLQDWPEAAFLILGDGPQREPLQRYAFELNILDNFYFISDYDTPEELFAASDVFVFTSRMEGISAGFLKAMALGKPVITFESGDVSHLITDNENGILVPLNDIYQMSQRLKSLLQDSSRLQQLGRRAQETVQNRYDFQTSVAEIEKIFLELYMRKAGGEYGTQNPRFSG